MFFSLCFLLISASSGFSESEFYLADDFADSYGARSLSAGLEDDFGSRRADKEASIQMVKEGMQKVVSLASALVEGTTPANKRSGVFLAAAKPELATKIQERLKDAQTFADKMDKAM